MSLAKFLNNSIEPSHYLKRVCYLKPKEPELQTIHLNSGKNEIGRSKETGIRDVKCSKQQLLMEVNMEKCQIQMRVLGVNPSSLNGFMMNQGNETIAQHGDVIEIVYGRHSFEIVFKPPPSDVKQTVKEEEPSTSQVNSNERWEVIEGGKLVIFNSKGVKSSNKVAGYDMDGTIINTKSGNVFPKNIDDWQILHPDIPPKLKKLFEDGYKVCLFTNQSGLANGKMHLDDFKKKIKAIVSKINIPMQVFIAVGEGFFRKPVPGMWKYLSEHQNDGIPISLQQSFYVGDAAGREAEGKRKRDHSCCDRLFALNVGVKFFTPEEHFFNKKPMPWKIPEFDPTKLPTDVVHIEPKTTKIPSSAPCELVIVVGLPGSGKSMFSKNTLEPLGYTIVNADTLGSVQACLNHCEKLLQSGKSCVADNTNVDVSARKKFLDIAKRNNIPCRCFIMNVSFDQVKHNIAFRQLTDTKHSKINQMIMNTFKKKYTIPSLDEGFIEIAKVNLKYQFRSSDEEKLFKLYLVEK